MERTSASMPCRTGRVLLLVAGVLFGTITLIPHDATAAANACRRTCKRSKEACIENARSAMTAQQAACTGGRRAIRACKRAFKADFNDHRKQCRRFQSETCKPCCKSGGTACDVACGNFVQDAGERCDDGNRVDGDGCEATCITTADACRGHLQQGDLPAAAVSCSSVAERDPTATSAKLAAALLKPTVALLDGEEIKAALRAYGIETSGSLADACSLRYGNRIAGDSPRTTTIEGLARTQVVAWADAILAGLTDFSDETVVTLTSDDLPACLRRLGTIEIDGGDVRLLRAFLQTTVGLVHTASAYDLGFDLADLVVRLRPVDEVLAANPQLFTLDPDGAEQLGLGRERVRNGLTELVGAVDFVSAETDDQSDDLVVVSAADRQSAERIRRAALVLRTALDGTGTFAAGELIASAQRLDLDRVFDGNVATLRPLLPTVFVGPFPDLVTLPDPTLAGMAPDMTRERLQELLDLRWD